MDFFFLMMMIVMVLRVLVVVGEADRTVGVAILSSVNLSLSTEAARFHVSPLSCSVSVPHRSS